MDKQRAKLILQSFRPDGADVDDCAFAEALHLAASDRELGEWLSHERAFDAEFSQALHDIAIPQTLRDDILSTLATHSDSIPPANDTLDASLIGALATMQPPAGLRENILSSMEASRAVVTMPRKKAPVWRRLGIPLAIAAGVALALAVASRQSGPRPASLAAHQTIPMDAVKVAFIRTLESPDFDLDVINNNPGQVLNALKTRDLPCPCCIVPGLENGKTIGCRELLVDGMRGSIVCFQIGEGGVVHMVIFPRDCIGCPLPTIDHPKMSQSGKWATATWQHDDNAYMLLTDSPADQLSALF